MIAARLARIFNEAVMGLLALVALATALGPMVFDVSPGVERLLTLLEWLLVATFAAEFVIQGAAASDRRAWLRSPWRIIDIVTVLGPIASLLPQVSDIARGSLMLRVLRIGRAVAFGTRAGSVVARQGHEPLVTVHETAPIVSVVNADDAQHPVESDWSSFIAWTRTPGPSWFHASNLNRVRFAELADAAGVSVREIERAISDDGHARLRQDARHATLVLQIPTVAETGFPEVRRERLFAIVTDRGLLTATTGRLHLQETAAAHTGALPPLPFPVRSVCALLAIARERNHAVAQRFESEARRLEGLDSGQILLQDTFRLRREISAVALDLWHVKGIVASLANGTTKLRGQDLEDEKFLHDLLHDTDSLYETVSRLKEDLKTLIELHINMKSFEMNTFLKLLAVVSFMGLIPSVVGGLLGMNVAGNPWSVTLGQVAFGVAMGMATSLYVFAVKGWLR